MNPSAFSRIKYGALVVFVLTVVCLLPAAWASKVVSATAIGVTEKVINAKVFEVSQVKINASPGRVWSILIDCRNAQKIYAKVVRCQLVKDEGENKNVAFSVRALGNLITLDYVLDVHEKYPNIEWTRLSGAFKSNEGYWHIEPCDDGKACTVSFAKFIDGGVIPQCVVNKEIKTSMPIIMAHLKSLSEQKDEPSAPPIQIGSLSLPQATAGKN